MAAKIYGVTTPDSVNTRIGALTFKRGFPTEETKRRVFDEIDYQRAVQAFLWGYPAVSFESIRLAASQGLGADFHDVLIADRFADPGGLWLTANDSTIYALTNVDLGKSGPVVVDVPPGLLVGLINDFWQRCIARRGPPRARRRQGWEFPPRASGLNRRHSGVRLSRRQSPAAQLQRNGSRDSQRRHGQRPGNGADRQEAAGSIRGVSGTSPKATRFISISSVRDRYASAAGTGILVPAFRVHQQQPGSGTRPLLSGDAQAAGHRERQALRA